MRGKRRSIIFPSLLSLCYVAESSVYELRYRSFSKNPRFVVSPWPPFAKSSLPDRTFDLERTISQHMDYFGREKESECVHARCTQRMGISSRNARYTLFFLKQTSENIFDLRNI